MSATGQSEHYAKLVRDRRASRHFSCGYYERFDPFLLDRKTFLAPMYEVIFARCFPRRVGTLIDVGCGTGLYWPILRRFCDRLIGVDASADMIGEANKLVRQKGWTNVTTFVRPMEDLCLPAVSADAVLCIDVLHHVDDVSQGIAQMARLLPPGGRLCAMEPNAFNPLIFLAHLLPAEERRAVTRNYAPWLRSRFRPYFQDIQTDYFNVVSSASSRREVEILRRIDSVIATLPVVRALSLRQLLTMQRR